MGCGGVWVSSNRHNPALAGDSRCAGIGISYTGQVVSHEGKSRQIGEKRAKLTGVVREKLFVRKSRGSWEAMNGNRIRGVSQDTEVGGCDTRLDK